MLTRSSRPACASSAFNAACVHRNSQPALETTYDRPLGGLGRSIHTTNPNFGKVEYFQGEGLTTDSSVLPRGRHLASGPCCPLDMVASLYSSPGWSQPCEFASETSSRLFSSASSAATWSSAAPSSAGRHERLTISSAGHRDGRLTWRSREAMTRARRAPPLSRPHCHSERRWGGAVGGKVPMGSL